MKKDRENLYKSLIYEFGKKQFVIAIEEMAELQKEISKFLRTDGIRENDCFNKKQIIEEMADVLITLEQLQMFLEIKDEEIEHMQKLKLARTKKWFDEYMQDEIKGY